MKEKIYYLTGLLCVFASVKATFYSGCPRDIDPCSSDVYAELDEPSRSTYYNLTGTAEDDYVLTEQWYRSVSGAGAKMPTEPVYTGQCNAYSPIWLNGSFPGANDGIVDIPGCASFLYDVCVREYTIPVKNCGAFYVYCLFPVSDSFDRFCMGSEVACPEGYTSENGFTPGCDIMESTTVVATTEAQDVLIGEGECTRDVDPCSITAYVELDEPTRSTGFNVTDVNEDDYILRQEWYRSISNAGSDMPNGPVFSGQCNAYAPIWLTDTVLREEGGIKDMLACASFLHDDCVRRYSIPVKNCGAFNVYCLYPVADSFDRFCMGSEITCPEGYTSNNGFTPGCEIDDTTEPTAPQTSQTVTQSTTPPLQRTTRSGNVDDSNGGKSDKNIVIIIAVIVPIVLFIIVTAIGVYFFMHLAGRKGTNDDLYEKPIKEVKEVIPENPYCKVGPSSHKCDNRSVNDGQDSVYEEIPNNITKTHPNCLNVEPTKFAHNLYFEKP